MINRIMRRELSHLFDEKLLVTDISGAGNNWYAVVVAVKDQY